MRAGAGDQRSGAGKKARGVQSREGAAYLLKALQGCTFVGPNQSAPTTPVGMENFLLCDSSRPAYGGTRPHAPHLHAAKYHEPVLVPGKDQLSHLPAHTLHGRKDVHSPCMLWYVCSCMPGSCVTLPAQYKEAACHRAAAVS